jgi:hypothetical protein
MKRTVGARLKADITNSFIIRNVVSWSNSSRVCECILAPAAASFFIPIILVILVILFLLEFRSVQSDA